MEKESKKALVVSAFPGTGKSYIFKHPNGLKVLDSDSSNFSWKEKGVRNPDFPKNYINHIKDNLDKCDIVMVSSHKDVRNGLVDAGIEFTLAFPTKDCKEEYLKRYKERGNEQSFIDMMDANWEKFISECCLQGNCKKVRLSQGQYLKDVLDIGISESAKPKRFFGMMPSSEVKIRKHYRDQHNLPISIDAGSSGWTVTWADYSTSYRDIENTPEANFKEAYDSVVKKGFSLKEEVPMGVVMGGDSM